jgi:hypothetical protein
VQWLDLLNACLTALQQEPQQQQPKVNAWRDLEMPYIGDRDSPQSSGEVTFALQ